MQNTAPPSTQLACKLSWVGPKKTLIAHISDLSAQLVSVGKDLKIQSGLMWLRNVQNGPKKNFPIQLGSSL